MNDDKFLEKAIINDKIRDIKVTRDNYEKKLTMENKKTDFISYIRYEIGLWKKKMHKNKERIIHLHYRALKYYKDDLSLWLSLIKFCMQADVNLVKDIFPKMLSFHKNESLWLLAAKFELDEANNIEKAVEYLIAGLNSHRKSSKIHYELFRIYLKSGTNLKKAESDARKQYQKILVELPDDVELQMKLLNLATENIFATKLLNEIAENLTKTFADNEDVWCTLAKRELEGHHFSKDNKYKFISPASIRFANMIKKFQYAVKKFQSLTISSKYLDTLSDLVQNEEYNSELVKESFMHACEEAHKSNLLSENYYLKWFEYLSDNPNLPKILQQATENNPKYLQVWITRLRYYISNGQQEEIDGVFNDAVGILKEDSAQIWLLKIQYHQVNFLSNQLEGIYRAAIQYSPNVSKVIKPAFLDWLIVFKLDKVREEYKILAEQEPWCMEMHKKMAEFEAMSLESDEKNLKLIQELAIKQFGKKIWLEYVNEEIRGGPQWKKDIYTKYFLGDG